MGTNPPIPYKFLLFLLILSAAILPAATSAATMGKNFTYGETVIVNTTYEYYGTNATPDWVWILTLAIGLVLTFFSFLIKPEESNASADALVVFAAVGSLFLLAGTIQSLTIDSITSSGLAGLTNTSITAATIILMEKHTLYSNVMTVPLVIVWVLSVFNLYRVYMLRSTIIKDSDFVSKEEEQFQ